MSPAYKRQKAKKLMKRGSKEKIRQFLILLGVFSLSAGFMGVLSIFKYLDQSFVAAFSSDTYSYNDSEYMAITYAVVEDMTTEHPLIKRLEYKLFDKNSKKIVTYIIPIDTKYDMPGKYGDEEVSKFLSVGLMNSSEGLYPGAKALNLALFKTFGFMPNKYIFVDFQKQSMWDSYWSKGDLGGFLNFENLKSNDGSLYTNLGLKEWYKVSQFIKSLPQDRIQINAYSGNFNTNDFDDLIRESSFDSSLAREKLTISVLNGTGLDGIASFGSRVVQNLGGRVVAINNTDNSYDTSIIIATDKNWLTVKELSRAFGIVNVVSKDEAYSIGENEVNRSDIVVILGFDIAKQIY